MCAEAQSGSMMCLYGLFGLEYVRADSKSVQWCRELTCHAKSSETSFV